MNLEQQQTPFDVIRREDARGEYWMGRELMPLLGYSNWRDFNNAINKATTALAGLGVDTREVFAGVRYNPSELGGRPAQDIRMTRQGAYMVAMNGDVRKQEIAAAQTYFAVKTRKMEIIEQSQTELPTDYLSALKALVVKVEENQVLELKAIEAAQKAEELRPPAEAWQGLVDTGQDYDMATAASILNRDDAISTGRDRLKTWMLRNRMAYRQAGGQLTPYAGHLDHLRLKPRSRPDHEAADPNARKEALAQLRVTVPGLSWIQQKMREQSRPDLMAVPAIVEAVEPPIDFDQYRIAALRRS